MTPEMLLAQSLGGLPTTATEKIAHTLSNMSIDELEQALRGEGVERLVKKSSANSLEKVAMADQWGRELAKVAFGLEQAAAVGKGIVGKGITMAAQKGPATMMAGGAALNAARKGLQTPQQGQSRMGNMARGAVSGAMAGGAVHAVGHGLTGGHFGAKAQTWSQGAMRAGHQLTPAPGSALHGVSQGLGQAGSAVKQGISNVGTAIKNKFTT